eukprot:TRINITY_DN7123_c0_g1_i2.p1 TRINITY_DN7123_c0_g1~~TRINITY_DN7123_c0_g1_i2.p1  ORF type:complete len:271 (-),score=89.77 TRINITY_DN7123_c0_g1_i2:109-921(-)
MNAHKLAFLRLDPPKDVFRRKFMTSLNQKAGHLSKGKASSVKGKDASSTAWLRRQLTDPFVKQAHSEGLHSRAAYKLSQINEKHKFLKPGKIVIDLGSAPGGWTEISMREVNARENKAGFPIGKVISVDLQEMNEIEGSRFVMGDFTEAKTREKIMKELNGKQVEVVLSDMAPSSTGQRGGDHDAIMNLLESVLEFSLPILKPGGVLLMKTLQGQREKEFIAELKKHFGKVGYEKPEASRDTSSEVYFFASKFRPATAIEDSSKIEMNVK